MNVGWIVRLILRALRRRCVRPPGWRSIKPEKLRKDARASVWRDAQGRVRKAVL